ncbi:hypothetical protein CUM68_05415, partial [Enterococcus faecium]|uniref:hypothetical protein n=1 Tax=Enterococcus faecium TaxID=1352 RepID=UPI000D444E2D
HIFHLVRLITADTRLFLDYHLFWIRGCGTTFVISPFLSKKKTAKEGEIVRKAFTIRKEVCYYSLVNIIML